ncbi:MAG TPA: hypothetical protein VF744_07885 [Beijerinckiaceae bacterium]|jgi:hypothetical protein
MLSTLDQLRANQLWSEGAPLRLHLGCGEQRFDGYVNIDFPPDQHAVMTVRPDLEADITRLSFPSESVNEIRLHAVFEHFDRVTALGLLIRWHGWLKRGGLLVLETPDFIETAKRAIAASGVDRMGFIRHLEGDQSSPWGMHIGQWYPERFHRTLSALGFADIETETSTTEEWHRVGLANVTARARKAAHLPLMSLLSTAEGILWESTVADAERPTWEVWRTQLRDFVLR